jgi:hypothetical protein
MEMKLMDQLDLFSQYSDDREAQTEYRLEDVEIRRVSLDDACNFYRRYHYAGGVANSATSFGVFLAHSVDMLCCVSFTTPCSENVRASVFGEEFKSHVAELGRLSIKEGVKMSASMIVPAVIEAYRADREARGLTPIWALISFADSTQGHHGGVYQAMSWVYTGESRNHANTYIDEAGRLRHSRQCGVNISAGDARERGWTVVPASGCKYRYIKMIHGSNRQKRLHMKMCKLTPQQYPKPQK